MDKVREHSSEESPRVLRRKIYGPVWERLKLFATLNEKSFRILWLLTQYQSHHFHIPFPVIVSELYAIIEKKNGTTRYPPTRQQILGKMFENKMKNFQDYFSNSGIDIVQYALKAPIGDLLEVTETCSDVFYSMEGSVLKLKENDWETLLNGSKNELKKMSVTIPQKWRKFTERFNGQYPHPEMEYAQLEP